MTDEILTRKQAIAQGNTQYFTGKPCPHGHIAKRYTITAACTQCVLGYQKSAKQRVYEMARRQASGFEKREYLIHPLDSPVIKQFVEFVSMSRLDPQRNGDIQLVQNYINSLNLAWSFGKD